MNLLFAIAGSGFRGPGLLALGLLAGGLLGWEVILRANAKRWPVWSLLPPAIIWIYVGAKWQTAENPLSQAPDPSWWWVACFILAPLASLPYAVFRAHERMEGR